MIVCGKCKLCCQWGTQDPSVRPRLSRKEADHLNHEVLPDGALVLQAAENGDCSYLGEGGCSIHYSDYFPVSCKGFDCRSLYAEVAGKKDTTFIRILAQGARKLEDDNATTQ